MPIQECISRVLEDYPDAMDEVFQGHEMAQYLRHCFPNELERLCETPDRYTFRGGPGQGQWNRSPWVGIFDVLITPTAQDGLYPVYLFREDFSGLYLSLNQGVTQIRNQFGREARNVLRARANDCRAQMGGPPPRFADLAIDLRPSAGGNMSTFYEAGNICAKFYDAQNIPDEDELINDYRFMLLTYSTASYNEDVSVDPAVREHDEENLGVEDLRTRRLHKRLDRNKKLARDAKRIHGYTCQACGFNFENIYGEIGHEFIEAHHLTPLHQLNAETVQLSPRNDFAVLCSNCHRMIHKTDAPHDIEGFSEQILN